MDDALIIQTAQNVDLAYAPAGLGQRVLAWLVDALIMTAYWCILVFGLPRVGLDNIGTVGSVVLGSPFLLYHPLCELFFEGQTAGKRALRIQVARLDGAAPTVGQYLLRWLFRLVEITISMGLPALITIALTRRSQRIGDIVAGTTVVRSTRRVHLHEVRYPVRPPSYAPSIPNAVALSDADVRTLRAVLVRLHREPASATAQALGLRAKTAVERRLGLVPSLLSPEGFIETVVADYTFLHDKYTGEG